MRASSDEADALLALMADISEEHYFAGWMTDLEARLYRIAFCGDDALYGVGRIDHGVVKRLRALAEASGVWFHWDLEVDDVMPLSLAEASARWGHSS